ncbi:MAG TPA: hypothetical protein VOA87_13420 [Thermoanaerobaculia bacterium]|nr:hypothetical protein [Thermoanaerobaculia bacterium]
MAFKLISIFGILVGVSCFWVATTLHPGGYDWSRDYISTLLRGPSSPARMLAVAGLLFFCVSIALVFERLARAVEFSKNSKVIQIGGIGSMVYASLTITPMHNLMVTISLAFFVIAVLALLRALYVGREIGFLVAGCVCLAVLVASAAVYYTDTYVFLLPCGQRTSFALFAVWLVALDFGVPRLRLGKNEPA